MFQTTAQGPEQVGQQAPTDTRPKDRGKGGTEASVHRASDMLEMREREGSDVLGAREDPGRRGRDASKHSTEVGIPQERRSQEVSQYSAEKSAPQ